MKSFIFKSQLETFKDMIASSIAMTCKTKIPSSTSGTKEFLRGTTQLTFKHANVTLIAITGLPVADYLRCFPRSPAQPSSRITGEFSLLISPLALLVAPLRRLAFPFDAVEGLSPCFPFSLTG
jgi:hypothetical protein